MSSIENIPDFSIAIPTFNRCNYLKKAIKSVLRQKNISLEIILSDNCSTDKTREVVKEFKDKRIKYFKNKKNIGFPLNVRKCLEKASGKYIFTLSDDDLILDEDTLFEILKVMEKYKVGVASIGAIYWSNSPKLPCKIFNLSDELIVLNPKKEKRIMLKTLKTNYLFYSGLIFKNSIVDGNKVIESYTYSFLPLVFDTAKEHGLAYIPNHFTLARISLRFMPHYYWLNRLGSFFIEDYLSLLRQFLNDRDYNIHKKEYIDGSFINLPSIKLFTNNRNYIKMLWKTISVDKTVLLSHKFIILALIGFMPKIFLKNMRDFMIRLYEKKTARFVEKYDYFKKLQKLGVS